MSYEIVHGDLSPGMPIELTRDGVSVDVSGADSVELHWVMPDGSLHVGILTEVDASTGRFVMNWQAGDTDQVGTYFGQVIVTKGGQETSYPNDGSRIIWWVNPDVNEYDWAGNQNPVASGVSSTRRIDTTDGLQGGGDLSADLVLSIADAGVTTAKLGDGQVTTAKLGDGQVTLVKLAADVLGSLTPAPGSVDTTQLANKAVTLGKLADIATNSVLGRISTGSGTPEILTGTQVTALLDIFTSTKQGIAPASGGGTSKFLRADGTWSTPPASAVVVDGSTITGSGVVGDPLKAVGAAPTGNAILQSIRLNPSITPGIFTISTVTHNWAPTNFATTTLIRAQSADNEGSRITGMQAGSDGAMKVILNLSAPVDDGVIAFQHENTGSLAANRFLCPNEDDVFVPKNGAAICIYDTTLSRWLVFPISGGRVQQLTAQQLGFFPESTTGALTGTLNDWEPVAASLQNATYASGLGAAGGSLLWKDASLWRVNVGAGGLTLTGATVYSNADSGGHSPLKILLNVGVAPLTLKHQNVGSIAANRFSCPGGVDVVVKSGEMCVLVSTSAAGWNVLACPQADGNYTSSGLMKTARLNVGWKDGSGVEQGIITPPTLANAQVNDWNPTGFATAGVIRVQSGGTSCVLTGMLPGAVGDIKILQVFNAAITFKCLNTGSTDGYRFITPNAADLTIPSLGSITFRYDANGYWWVIGYAK